MSKRPNSPATGPPTMLARIRWWLTVIFEVGLLFGIIVGAEVLSGDGRIGAYRVHPHPYWLAVLPMAAGRGLFGGLLAAGVATVLYVTGAREAVHAESFARLLSLDVMLEPILFFAVCFLVGEFRDVVGDRIRRLVADLESARTEAIRVRGQRDVLTEANRILERRIVDQHSHFGSLVGIVSRTENASRNEIFDVALELVEEHCGAAASILIPLVDGRVKPAGQRGIPIAESAARMESTSRSEAVRRAMVEGREINAFSLVDRAPTDGPLVVSPLLGASGVIEALLCLEDVPASLLNTSTIRTFQAIGRWASAMLTRIERESSQPAGGPGAAVEPSREWLGTTEDLARRLVHEYDRANRYGLPLSFLAIRVMGVEGEDSPTFGKVDDFVIQRFATRIRCSDAVYRFPHPGCYLMVLPGTPLEGAECVKKRLAPEDRTEWSAPGRLTVDAAAPGPDSPDPENLVKMLIEVFRSRGELVLGGDLPISVRPGPWVGRLHEFGRALVGELGLAMRNEYPLQVLAFRGERTDGVDAAALTHRYLELAEGGLRGADAIFTIGPNHLAAILPHTRRSEAEVVAGRIRSVFEAQDADAPYGKIVTEVLSYGPRYPIYGAFLEELGSARPLRDVVERGVNG